MDGRSLTHPPTRGSDGGGRSSVAVESKQAHSFDAGELGDDAQQGRRHVEPKVKVLVVAVVNRHEEPVERGRATGRVSCTRA